MQKLNLDSELLNPMRKKLEQSIDILTKNAIITRKESEITLKINIGVIKNRDEDKKREWIEPRIEYKIDEKIKETKSSYKGNIGKDYQIEIDEDTEDVCIKKVNEQVSIFKGGK